MPLPNRLIIAIGLGILSVVALVFFVRMSSVPEESETLATITFELADTDEERTRGLSGRAEIPHHYAMLFVFEQPARYGFWMKDMLAPIDIVWLDEAGIITKIDAHVAPSMYPTLFYPPYPTRYVVETAAGEAKLLGWEVGMAIALPR